MVGKRSRSPFLESVREAVRVKQYSYRTEQAYVYWARRFILFHEKRHPADMGEEAVAAFLTHPAVERDVAPSTQNQALNALVFLYRHVVGRPLGAIVDATRAKRTARLPAVLTVAEVGAVLRGLEGAYWMMGCLLYGSGLRLRECVSLRVKDLDFAHRAVVVRQGKGGKDRVVTMPDELLGPLERHRESRRTVHHLDLERGRGSVWLPHALARKYPGADQQWMWGS